MFEEEFLKTLSQLSSDVALPLQLWKELKSYYCRADRYYHNLTHLDHLHQELLPVKDLVDDWQVLVLSVAYHDSIYNTIKQDNEEKSAKYALEKITKLNLSESRIQSCKEQILATKGHQHSKFNDTNYFTDADLSILGMPENVYEDYINAVRKEYAFYPDFLYKPGRQKVLKHFLGMNSVYKTDHFKNKYEMKARQNMEAELRSFSGRV